MAFGLSQNTGFPSASSTAPSFNFGTSTTTAARGFGTPSLGFGGTTTTGGFGTAAPPAFGATQATTGFGAQPSTGFGTQTATGFGTQPSTGFGAPAATPGFGTQPSTGFGATSTFGAPTTSAFGSTFGTSTATTGFGFGTTATSTPSLFGGTTSGGLFGSTQPATTNTFQGFGTGASTFGAASSQPGGLFGGTGLQTSTAGTGFGNTFAFNAKPGTTQTTSFGGFGTGGGLFGQSQPQPQFSLGAPQQQQQQQQQAVNLEMTDYVTANICGDDRDSTITNWNKLQARWGFGKGFISGNVPPVPYNQSNMYCCLKAVGYNLIPTTKEEDGMVAICVTPRDPKQQPDPSQMQASLSQAVLAGKPSLVLIMHGVRAVTENSHQYTVSLNEKQSTGQTKRAPATELANFLIQARNSLAPLGVDNVIPLVPPTKEYIKEYLANPPSGIDRKLWEQAIKDNPDPERLIPTPMVGFVDLKSRIKCQEMESSKHLVFLQQAETKVSELRRAASETEVKLNQRRQALVSLQHRLLSVLVKLQVARRTGSALLPIEEDLRMRLEKLKSLIAHPSQCKAKLGEIVAKTNLQKTRKTNPVANKYSIDPDSLEELQKFMSLEHKGITELINISQMDQLCVKLIKQSLEEVNSVKNGNKSSYLVTRAPQATLL